MILWPFLTYRRLERPGQWRLSLWVTSPRRFRYYRWDYPEGKVYAVWLYVIQVKLMVKA